MTSSPPATVHVGPRGQERGATPAPPLDRATTVRDTLIIVCHARLRGADGGATAVARLADQNPARRGYTGRRSARAPRRVRGVV